jgi:hypothetical protein
MTVADLVARARHLHATVSDLKTDVIDAFEAPGRAVLVHRMTGRDRTGQPTDALTIDVLVLAGGLITDVWVTSGPPPSG